MTLKELKAIVEEYRIVKQQKEDALKDIDRFEGRITLLFSEYKEKVIEIDELAKKISALSITENIYRTRKPQQEAETERLILEISNKNKEVETLKITLTKTHMELSSLIEQKAKLQEEYDNLDVEYKKKKSAKEAEIKKLGEEVIARENKIIDREKEADLREGNLSLREAGLEKKRAKLITVKSNMEKVFEKSVNLEI